MKKGFIEENGKRIPVSEIENIDLHKPFVDKILFEKNGRIYKRTPELIDVWFDSGSMPFAQYHYPFENKDLFEKKYFPADFICEGIDQTRGWFYTLHAIATMLFDSVAYKNVIVNELILDKNGMKMSKSKGNSVDPFVLFDKYGADATRWYLVTNSPPWRPTLFDEDGLVEAQRKFFGTLMNTYAFFGLYSNIDKFTHKESLVPYDERPEIDRWIISVLGSLVADYQLFMDEYDVTKASRAVASFTIDQLSNWYVRRSRRRFWKSEMNRNKLSAYQTLYECLITVSKLTSPFAPFVSEEIYRNLNSITGKEEFESVHLSRFPVVTYRSKELEEKMDVAQKVVSLTRAMRAKNNLKVRQPLRKIMVVVDSSKRAALEEMKDVILEEVNIKELIVLKNDAEIVNKTAKPNFKSIGPKFGKNANKIAAKVKEFNNAQIAQIERGEQVKIELNNEIFSLSKEDVEIISTEIKGWLVESEVGVTVAIDIELDNNLISEGLAREFVNRVQNMRKDSGFEVTDKIKIEFNGSEKLIDAVNVFKDYISNETLARELIQKDLINGNTGQNWNIGEYACSIRITKVI